MKRLAVSIVLYHTPEEEVRQIVQQISLCPEVEHIYLLDNSEQATTAYDGLADYRFNNANLGYGRAHNIALRESLAKGTDYHLVVNSDIQLRGEDLTRMLDYLEVHPEVGHMMPKIVNEQGETQHLCKQLPTPMDVFGRRFLPRKWMQKRMERYEMRDHNYDEPFEAPYLSGCFMLLRVSALKEVGLFDERFFMYPEDIDLTRRIHERYKTLYWPLVSVVHAHRQGSYHSLRLLWIHAINMLKYFNKYGFFSTN